MKKIGVIGSGVVGKTLATGLNKHGYQVMLGSGDKAKRDEFTKETGIKTGSFGETATFAEIVIIAVKGDVAERLYSRYRRNLRARL